MIRVAHSSGRLRVAILAAGAGLLFCLALLVRETPYTLVAFMFLGQPLLVVAVLIFGWEVVRDLRRTKVL
jgi:hypothetical protein